VDSPNVSELCVGTDQLTLEKPKKTSLLLDAERRVHTLDTPVLMTAAWHWAS